MAPFAHTQKTEPPPILEIGGGNGAGEETRTLDVHLGKVVLYQLSYARGKERRSKGSAFVSVNTHF